MTRRQQRSFSRPPSSVVLAVGAAALVALPIVTAASVPNAPTAATGHALASSSVTADAPPPAPDAPPSAGAPVADPIQAAPTAMPPPTLPRPPGPGVLTTAKPGSAAAAAIAFALAQRGLPYVWGGDGPEAGERGFDCSGLTTAAFAYAGITLPRTAHTQFYAGPHVPDGAELEPGDLVFYGVPERVHHVGLYLGGGRMINAPTFGKPVRTAFVRYPGDDYLGATRPAAGRDAPGLLESPQLPVVVPPVPLPEAPPGPTEFPAPPAPDEVAGPAPALPAQQAPTAAPGEVLAAPAGATPTDATPTDAGPTDPGTPVPPSALDGAAASVTSDPPSGDTALSRLEAAEAGSTTPPTAPTSPTTPTTAATPTSPTTVTSPTTPATPTSPTTPATPATPATPTTPTTPTSPTTSGPTTPATTGTGAAGTVPAAPGPESLAPTTVTLPGGRRVNLVGAERDDQGLPVVPPGSGSAGLLWARSEGGWTAAVALPPGTDLSGLDTGAAVVLTGPDTERTELAVRSRRTVDRATAADATRHVGDRPRLVLLLPGSGKEITVVVAG